MPSEPFCRPEVVLEDRDRLVGVEGPAVGLDPRGVVELLLVARGDHQAGVRRVGVARHRRGRDVGVVDRVGEGAPDPDVVEALALQVEDQQRQVARQVVRLLLQPGGHRLALVLPHLPDLRGELLAGVDLPALQLDVAVVAGLEDRVHDRQRGRGAEDARCPSTRRGAAATPGSGRPCPAVGPRADRLQVGLGDDLVLRRPRPRPPAGRSAPWRSRPCTVPGFYGELLRRERPRCAGRARSRRPGRSRRWSCPC